MNINIINKLLFFLIVISSFTFSQENKLGGNILIYAGSGNGGGIGLRGFFESTVMENFSVRPSYQVLVMSDKYAQFYHIYAIDFSYKISMVYAGIAPTYNIFINDMEGNMPGYFIINNIMGASYKNSYGIDFLFGFEGGSSKIFSPSIEIRYSLLRPDFVLEKRIENKTVKESLKTNMDNIKMLLGFSINF